MPKWTHVENLERRFGSALSYWHTRGPNCEPLLFTKNELTVAWERARVNPEDIAAFDKRMAELFLEIQNGP